MKLFSCENISRYYQNIPTIVDVNLHLNKGELVGLLGTSGVGKTTLFNILSGVDQPDTGKVFLDEKDITGSPGKISYMLQKDLLLPFKTILENVSLPLLINGIPKKEAQTEAERHFSQFGLSGYEDRYPTELSGGMKQRAALLRTFLTRNQMILLDEPFSALDPLTKREMHQWYLDIVSQLGLTTLFVTHDIDEAILLSDRIYILAGKPGKIVKHIDSVPEITDKFLISSEYQELKLKIINSIDSL